MVPDRLAQYPDWYRPSKYRARSNELVLAGLHPMGALLGDPDTRCRTCVSLEDHGRWKKCARARQTRGPATDVRLKWRGCQHWEAAEDACHSSDDAAGSADAVTPRRKVRALISMRSLSPLRRGLGAVDRRFGDPMWWPSWAGGDAALASAREMAREGLARSLWAGAAIRFVATDNKPTDLAAVAPCPACDGTLEPCHVDYDEWHMGCRSCDAMFDCETVFQRWIRDEGAR